MKSRAVTWIAVLLVAGLGFAACSGGTTVEEVAASTEDGLAPDFSLELADGGEFVLSAQTKPTYLVFWAEW